MVSFQETYEASSVVIGQRARRLDMVQHQKTLPPIVWRRVRQIGAKVLETPTQMMNNKVNKKYVIIKFN